MIGYTRSKYAHDFLFEGRHIVSDYAIERNSRMRFLAIGPKEIFSEERKYLNGSIDKHSYYRRCGMLAAYNWEKWKPTDMFT